MCPAIGDQQTKKVQRSGSQLKPPHGGQISATVAFARRQPLDLKPTNVNALIAGMSDFFRRALGKRIDLEVVGGARLWQVEPVGVGDSQSGG